MACNNPPRFKHRRLRRYLVVRGVTLGSFNNRLGCDTGQFNPIHLTIFSWLSSPFFMDSLNGPPSASSPSVPFPSHGARRAVADFDTNDTDLGTTSPQKLANEVREPLALYIG